MSSQLQQSRWVLLAQAGDREALDQLLRSIQSPFHGYLLRLCTRPADADEVLQETLLQVYRKLRWLREPALLRPWAFRIASRMAFKHLRRQRRWPDPLEDGEAIQAHAKDPIDIVLDHEERERLPEVLNGLSPRSRAVIHLHHLEGHPLADVATILDIPLGTVKSRLAYGLEKLRNTRREP
jgi:RNA polymerase sigma-70 factor (ECF subfamily)